jgi:hypothetical protein
MDAITPHHDSASCAVLLARHWFDLDFLMWPVTGFNYKEWNLPANTEPIVSASVTYWQVNQIMRIPMVEDEHVTPSAKKRQRGRPRAPSHVARPHRLVTFVTDRELQYLMRVVAEEERSMASVIHRIIAAHIV